MHLRTWTLRSLSALALQWLLVCAAVAVLTGSASALFLFSLDWATRTREAHPGLIWGLPFVGFAVGWLYLKWGQSVDAGNNLLIDEIHDPKNTIPLRMAPLILAATVVVGMTPWKTSDTWQASVGARWATAVLETPKPVLPQEFGKYLPST